MRIKINDDGSDGAGVEGRRSVPEKKKSVMPPPSSSPASPEPQQSSPSETDASDKSKKKVYGGSLKVIEGDGLPGKADRN